MSKINFRDPRIKIGWFDASSEKSYQRVDVPFWSNLLQFLTTNKAWERTRLERITNPEWERRFDEYCKELKQFCDKKGITEERIYRDFNIVSQMYEWFWYPPHDHCNGKELRWSGIVEQSDNMIVFGELKNLK